MQRLLEAPLGVSLVLAIASQGNKHKDGGKGKFATIYDATKKGTTTAVVAVASSTTRVGFQPKNVHQGVMKTPPTRDVASMMSPLSASIE